jgi:hypothetical protein
MFPGDAKQNFGQFSAGGARFGELNPPASA